MKNKMIHRLMLILILPIIFITSVSTGYAYWFYHGEQTSEVMNLNIEVAKSTQTEYARYSDLTSETNVSQSMIYSINITTNSSNNKGSKFDLYATNYSLLFASGTCFCTKGKSYKGDWNVANYLYFRNGKAYYSISQGLTTGCSSFSISQYITLNSVTIYTDSTKTTTLTLYPNNQKVTYNATTAFMCDTDGTVYKYDLS